MTKHKKWIEKIVRTKKVSMSRYKKIRLDKNERISPFEANFFKKFISEITSEKISSYPEVSNLYRALANLHKRKINQFVITPGADGAIKNCFELFVTKGDKVITLQPTFAMVDIYCKVFGAKKVSIQYDKKINLNINYLIKSITSKISLIIIANPNSPTGTLIAIQDMEKIIKKANIFGIPILVDEAYYGFSNKTVLPLLKKYKNLIVSRTFSKAYGLAGLRVGYMVTNSKIAKLLFNLKPMYEVNSVGIIASLIMLKNLQIYKNYISETKKGLNLLIKYLIDNKISFLKTHANFIYINLGKKINYYHNKLSRYGILTKKGLTIKGYENYLRITLGPPKQIKTIISKLKILTKN